MSCDSEGATGANRYAAVTRVGPAAVQIVLNLLQATRIVHRKSSDQLQRFLLLVHHKVKDDLSGYLQQLVVDRESLPEKQTIGFAQKVWNPLHGSVGIVQILPTHHHSSNLTLRAENDLAFPKTHWISARSVEPLRDCVHRLDLNHPPTAVDGIRKFSTALLVGWT
jgi:hypothetical protein